MNATEKDWTINEIQAAMRADGSHWWDPDSMRFFGTRVLNGTVYKGTGGIYFVTSEWDGFSGKENNRRAYSVRKFNPDTLDIDTVGSIGDFRTGDEAVAEAERLTGAGVAIREQHRPVTVLDQFRADISAHTGRKCDNDDAESLIILGKKHHKMMEDYCNGVEIYRADGEPKAPLKKLREHIMLIAQHVGCTGVNFQGDPRGCTVKLVLPDGFTNDWGKEGVCVPNA